MENRHFRTFRIQLLAAVVVMPLLSAVYKKNIRSLFLFSAISTRSQFLCFASLFLIWIVCVRRRENRNHNIAGMFSVSAAATKWGPPNRMLLVNRFLGTRTATCALCACPNPFKYFSFLSQYHAIGFLCSVGVSADERKIASVHWEMDGQRDGVGRKRWPGCGWAHRAAACQFVHRTTISDTRSTYVIYVSSVVSQIEGARSQILGKWATNRMTKFPIYFHLLRKCETIYCFFFIFFSVFSLHSFLFFACCAFLYMPMWFTHHLILGGTGFRTEKHTWTHASEVKESTYGILLLLLCV